MPQFFQRQQRLFPNERFFVHGERQQRDSSLNVLQLGQTVRGGFGDLGGCVLQGAGQPGRYHRAIEIFQHARGLQANDFTGVGQGINDMRDHVGVRRFRQIHDRDLAGLGIGIAHFLEDILDIFGRIEWLEYTHMTLPQKIGDADGHGARGAIGLAGHAVPAFVIFHVGLARFLADPQHIQRADIDTNGAALFRDAFRFIDRHGNGGRCIGYWHGSSPETLWNGSDGSFTRQSPASASTRWLA